ncbi:hypothetical protein E2C01_043558 [Portunus trituberculatus]|uniref:Uncharacterized protein n=1 Tax=Portunus trituberculatus TaxID=210409 RepID=A0A5B7FW22_PORTR|nr:hypothetical protein [Portunus trituberculatus]
MHQFFHDHLPGRNIFLMNWGDVCARVRLTGLFTSWRRRIRLSCTLSSLAWESSKLSIDLMLSLDDPVALLLLLPWQDTSGGRAVQSSSPYMTDTCTQRAKSLH